MEYVVEVHILQLQEDSSWKTVFSESLRFKENIWRLARDRAVSRYVDFIHDGKLDRIFNFADPGKKDQLSKGDYVKDISLKCYIQEEVIFLSGRIREIESQLQALHREAGIYTRAGQMANIQLDQFSTAHSSFRMIPDSSLLLEQF